MKKETVNGITFYHANNDVNGNPRCIVHWVDLITDTEKSRGLTVDIGYKLACKRANKLGGRKYMGKDFGGGVIFNNCSIDSEADMEWLANRIKNVIELDAFLKHKGLI